jgi:hypothetical protein
LRELGIEFIWAPRKHSDGIVRPRRLTGASLSTPGGLFAPTVVEMQAELKQHFLNNPDYQKTEVQKLFDKHRFKLIYTPPYTPTTHPIELIWGYVKSYVARQYFNGRNMEKLREQTIAGMYGESDHEHEGVTAELCQKMIKHCHKWCDSFIQSSSELHGSVNNLHLVSRPEGLMDNSIESDEEQEADPFGGGDVESDEEYNI